MKRILFIDRKNAARSQMAEAWFNRFGEGWGRALSCGTMPAEKVDPLTREVLTEAGLDMCGAIPKSINTTLLAQADIVVLMGKDVYPGAFQPDYVWDFQDPTGRELIHFRVQSEAIRLQIQELIVQLQRLQFAESGSDWIHPSFLQREMLTRDMLRS